MLVNLNQVLGKARNENYAVPAFDISNYEMLKAVMEAVEEEKSPVILMALVPDLAGKGIRYLSAMFRTAAEDSEVPVCIHLDHCVQFELIKRAIEEGFTSVMFDGSTRPFAENAERTREVVEYAHRFGVSVEAELGHVGDGISGSGESQLVCAVTCDANNNLTQPEEVVEFLKITEVDALAVAIGSAHGVYREKPQLRLQLLHEINKISSVPLVLHGGSGIPDTDVKQAVQLGICKVNVYTEIVQALFTTLYSTLLEKESFTWPVRVYENPIAAMKGVAKAKIKLLGSNGKA